ncbi:MAG: translational GTPase TypA [Clostridia bacterium]|nr:translational GTPase TypA [Clostridia bacterium]
MIREDIRNIAIIAHVDHGKTTLVDQLLHQSGIFRANENVQERVMDSNDLERERGITILSKNTAVSYNGIKFNIIDTPGHADFGGEVERILTMVDGVLLVVDAFEGVMPQTRFVLHKALALNKRIVVVVNKIDRDGARPNEVVDEILDLFIDLDASDELLDFPVVYASARDGWASLDADEQGTDMRVLFDTIREYIPAPVGETEASLQMMISNIDYNEYVGRIAVGRVERGSINRGQTVLLARADGSFAQAKVGYLYQFDGLRRTEVETSTMGDIVAVAGLGEVNIGETICGQENPEPLDFVNIDAPTLSMHFIVNDSPFAGREGQFVTSRHLRQRLYHEVETNVSMRVEDTDSPDTLLVSGRGELHLSILIETMRREGYEFSVSRPRVIYQEKDGKHMEPMELLTVDVTEEYMGSVIEKLGTRKAEMLDMHANNQGGMRITFRVPARGLMGYRSEFLTDTRGNGVMNHVFDGYEPYKGDIPGRTRGSLVAHEAGDSSGYGLFYAQERGRMFLGPGVAVYEGMIVGENAKAGDMVVNVCRKKHVTNMRASGSDEALRLTPPTVLSLEQCLSFLADDELLEVTPKNLRLRKAILSNQLRAKKNAQAQKQ